MRDITCSALALAAILAAAMSPAAASDRHPWCLVLQDCCDGWACGYDTFAQCLAEARPGNVGYCAANPNYPTPAPAASSRQRRKTR
jgi:Protein of unknown function (DUF3551)